MSDEVAIRVEGLSKVYRLYDKPVDRLKESLHPLRKKFHREFYALNDVSFSVKKGETVGIIGQNGSGKSTLLKIITGVLSPSAGQVHVAGRISALLELGTGFNPELTGVENVFFNGMVMGYSREEMDARLDSILAFADIGDFVYQPVKTYSSGMFVRLAFAVATAVEPEILIVDEALAVGDIRFTQKCYRLIRKLQEGGTTVLFVSHSTSDVVRLCSRAIWLKNGSIHRSGAAKQVTEEYHAWMVHDVLMQDAPKTQEVVESNENGYRLYPIKPDAMINGEGGAKIEAVNLLDENDNDLTVLDSHKKVKLLIKVRALSEIEIPYVSFHIVDAKGILLTGSNNHVLGIEFERMLENEVRLYSFEFELPELHNGDYLIALGFNDGTMERHLRHQYVMDAIQIKFVSTSLKQLQSLVFKLRDCSVNELV